jgi:hypothetical protein
MSRVYLARVRLRPPRRSAFWHRFLPAEYRVIRIVDPLVRSWWRPFGLGNVVELRVAGRRSGHVRRVLLGLLRDDGRWFVGHPNGDVEWTRNLEAAITADLAFHAGPVVTVRASRLEDGPLRDRAIALTGQHPFPGNLVYRLARPHIRAVGTYFELRRVDA